MRSRRRSRVLWFNGLAIVVAAIVELVPALQGLLPDSTAVFAVVLALGNIVLRQLTTQPLEPLPPRLRRKQPPTVT